MTIYADRTQGKIAREMYGHFIEHFGHCIYDGIWVGKKSSIPNINGVRKEAIDVLKAVNAPLIRWPGGYFADCYNWQDGIGPAENRPVRFHECETDKKETNQFGTHEFLDMCEMIGAEPNICVNTAFLSAIDAGNWVEYCNAEGGTSFADLRRKNGREKPWKTKYWAIGNESYYLHTPEDYIQNYLLWRRFLRRIDPEVKCIAGVDRNWGGEKFCDSGSRRFHEVLEGIGNDMELASLHIYCGAGISGDQFTDEEYWRTMVEIEQRNRFLIESFMGAIDSVVGNHKVKLALDEWGIWHVGSDIANGCEQVCTQRDAVFTARYFHMLHDYADRVGLATVAQSVNVLHALLKTDGPRSYRTPAFHVFEMFKGHQGADVLQMVHTSPTFEFDKKNVCRDDNKIDKVSASATKSANTGEILLTMTNADLEKSYDYEIDLVGKSEIKNVEGSILVADPRASNTFEKPDEIKSRKHNVVLANGRIRVTIPACSVIAVQIK
jgi:alpha-N-arabinofuranosidase